MIGFSFFVLREGLPFAASGCTRMALRVDNHVFLPSNIDVCNSLACRSHTQFSLSSRNVLIAGRSHTACRCAAVLLSEQHPCNMPRKELNASKLLELCGQCCSTQAVAGPQSENLQVVGGRLPHTTRGQDTVTKSGHSAQNPKQDRNPAPCQALMSHSQASWASRAACPLVPD